MSNLLLDWLNNEVVLSIQIYNFSESFRNGYLFGELLSKFNQQNDFHTFIDKESPLSCLNNFQKLEPTMKKINVNFNSRIVQKIMDGDEKMIKSLLYELKASLEQLARYSTMSIGPKLRGTKHDRVFNVVQNTRPAYDQTKSKTFQAVVRGVLENTNEVLMNEAIRKYTVREDDYHRTISTGELADWDQLTLERKRAKDIYLTRKQHETEFKQVWNTMNEQQWKKNQITAHKRKELYNTIEQNLTMRREKKISEIKNDHRDYTIQSMNEFDKRLEDMILPTSNDDEKQDDSLKNSFVRSISLK